MRYVALCLTVFLFVASAAVRSDEPASRPATTITTAVPTTGPTTVTIVVPHGETLTITLGPGPRVVEGSPAGITPATLPASRPVATRPATLPSALDLLRATGAAELGPMDDPVPD